MKTIINKVFIMIFISLISCSLSAQTSMTYEKAKTEIQEQFGTIPTMFKVYPKHALAGAWENFKQLNSPTSKIPAKYRELLQLAVSSQIPCQYCVYFHTASAKAYGASDEEIQEAIAHGGATRNWSMILQGNQVEYEAFKIEFDNMMKYMADKQKK